MVKGALFYSLNSGFNNCISSHDDVRSSYATSKNLKECIESGKFREDLFYRRNVVPITTPPLRERKEDIPHLIDHFLKHFKDKFNKVELNLSQPAYDAQ
ncbi:sigma 54-interacting transcriptional regulator, partial [Candidatus Hakubella thermalkaliphila]|uniref:sigma 54-interacting transcriptional regulator n=1 Tax=Candidatus Hakubella thermalkaliphila TaxID=2754717 RepID=UPI00280B7BD4